MEKLSIKTPENIGNISFSNPESEQSPLFNFRVNKSFTPLDTSEEVVRIYRGIEYGDSYDQVASMARAINRNSDPDAPFTFKIVYQTSQELLPLVLELAENPTPENYLKYCELSEKLRINYFPKPVEMIDWEGNLDTDNFIGRLIEEHRYSACGAMNASPYLGATEDLNIAVKYGKTIVVADVPKKELIYSEYADPGEVLIKGQLKPQYIRGTIENIYNPTRFLPSKNILCEVDSLLTEFLR